MYIDVSLNSESLQNRGVEFFKIQSQSRQLLNICFYKVVIFVYKK